MRTNAAMKIRREPSARHHVTSADVTNVPSVPHAPDSSRAASSMATRIPLSRGTMCMNSTPWVVPASMTNTQKNIRSTNLLTSRHSASIRSKSSGDVASLTVGRQWQQQPHVSESSSPSVMDITSPWRPLQSCLLPGRLRTLPSGGMMLSGKTLRAIRMTQRGQYWAESFLA